jgi:glyoxylase-like metal-dependent hydrolase (beta-lactamase superfamily II)
MYEIHCLKVYTALSIGSVNSYLITGDDEPTLIDVGPNLPGVYESLVDGLAAHGYRPRDIKRLVITHGHVDHFGVAKRLVDESGAKVLSHESNASVLTDYYVDWARRSAYYLAFYQRAGAPPEVTRDINSCYSRLVQAAQSVSLDKPLRDGDVITLGGAPWEVLHTPGHSVGAICLYQPDSAALISGDTLLRDTSSNPILDPGEESGPRPRMLVGYLNSLRRLAALQLNIIYPGHGELFSEHRELIRGRLEFHQRRKEVIHKAILGGCRTAYEITKQLFPRVPSNDMPLAMFETLGHLDLLEDEGRVRYEMRDGVVYIQALCEQPI